MNCNICENNKWKSLDYLRKGRPGFIICKECGFVTYRYKPIVNILEFYKGKFVCNDNNWGRKKNEFHGEFLKEFMPEIKTILDFGCGDGYAMEYLQNNFNVKCTGYDWSLENTNYARNKRGLHISGMASGEYDMIMMFHVLEHLQNPLIHLRFNIERCRKYFYISVPLYFGELYVSGEDVCDDFERVYHKEHINCFGVHHFLNLLSKVGLRIVKCDTNFYGFTVLCEKVKILTDDKFVKYNYKEIIDIIKRQKKAIKYVNKGKYDKALNVYPYYKYAKDLLNEI